MTRLLDRIAGPEDLKQLKSDQLIKLARELRERIIHTTSQTGGHVGPSLGVVELTLALHTVFDSPRDRIIWDVGHQSYAHKLLTGRAGRFHTLRQYGGLSGFPRRRESPHDAFGTGHASTSISAALGLARARDLRGDNHHVVAVIGDGAMTGGLAFEGLNNAGIGKTGLIVVLNDNSMSISSNVGAVATYLGRLRSDPTYSRVKADVENALRRIPIIGDPVQRAVEKLKDSLKYLVLPGMLFEELGFTYLGPTDGHNIAALQAVLRNARKVAGPVLVHVLTHKGQGFGPAEVQPERFHGVGPFDVRTGRSLGKKSKPTYSELFGRALVDLAHRDPAIVAICAAMPDGTGLSEFARTFPDRFFDVGIAEGHAVTFAAGMAAGGFKPVVAVYSTFMQRAFDQITHDVCLQDLPVVFALDRAGIVGEDGSTHHGLMDLSYLRCIPNMTIGAPSSGTELRDMLHTAFQLNRPVALRYPRAQSEWWPEFPDADRRLLNPPAGEERVRGGDAAIIACGFMVDVAVDAAEILRRHQLSASVINMRWIKPLDTGLLSRVLTRVRAVVTLEENSVNGGLGSAVLEAAEELGTVNVPIRCLGVGDRIVEHGPRSYLLSSLGLTPDKVAASVLDLLSPTQRPLYRV